MADGIPLARLLTLTKHERDKNKQDPLCYQHGATNYRVIDELKRRTLPQPLHDALIDELNQMVEKQLSNQIKKAEAPRADTTLESIIKKLATHAGTAKDLWPRLFGMLDDAGMEPSEHDFSYQYLNTKDRQKTITFKTFQNKLSKARKQR